MSRPRWTLRYAPHLGFRDPAQPLFLETVGSPDPIAQIEYIAACGFAGIEDNGLMKRPVEVQAAIGEALAKHGLEMGCLLLQAQTPAGHFWGSDDPGMRADIDASLRQAIETARRVDGRLLCVASMRDFRVPLSYELAGMVKNLRRVAPVAEKAGVTLCLEHINAPRLPDRLLQHVSDSYLVACAADSDAVKIIYDTVHVQVQDGNLVENMDRCWDKIGVFQLADYPGRNEPGTGEINFVHLLRHVHRKGYRGLLELEHTCEAPGKAGEQQALARLRAIDSQIDARIG